MTENNSSEPRSDSLYPELEHLGDATEFLEDILEFVQHIPLLDSFDVSDIQILARYMRCYGSPGGVELLHEGGDDDYLLLILTGEMVIHRRDPHTGESKRIAVAGPGTTLGEMALVDGQPRSASCSTVAPTDFAVLTRQALDEVAEKHPTLGHRLMLVLLQLLARRLRDTNDALLPHIAATATV